MSLDMLVHVVIVLIILGLVWWLLQTYILPKVAEPFRTMVIVVVVLCVILYLLSLLGGIPAVHFGKLGALPVAAHAPPVA